MPRRQCPQRHSADCDVEGHHPHVVAGGAQAGREARARSGGGRGGGGVVGVAQITGAKIDLHYKRNYPVVNNHAAETEVARRIARNVAGEANVHEMPPLMGGEDFAYMLEARPGAFIFCGNGDSAGLHHPAYNFNDEAIVFGTSYWVKLVEESLAAS
ncbi:M20/M25/M40 family metallo-hydrolase [Bradyrhizobium sp. S3.14.4]